MLWMALMLLVFLGLAALVIDLGYARLAQRQMQTAVNSAALEGMRYRDVVPSGEDPATYRRQQAALFAQLASDDDLNLAANDTTIGAGIATNLIQGEGYQRTTIGDGTTDLEADLAARSGYVYRPAPELNEENEPHGDLVAGNYLEENLHQENADYTRTDFVPAVDGDAFLVRLRRAGVSASALDDEPGVSSNGGGLPLLFGHGAAFAADSTIRTLGTTVRATAIARARPVRVAWRRTATHRGFTPFMIDVGTWMRITECEDLSDPCDTANVLIEFTRDGQLASIHRDNGVVEEISLTATVNLAVITGADKSAIAYGDLLEGTPPSTSGQVDTTKAHYVPLFVSSLNNGPYLICGFGWVEAIQFPDNNEPIKMTVRFGHVAPENASARLQRPLQPQAKEALKEGLEKVLNDKPLKDLEDLMLRTPVLAPSGR